MNEGGEVNGNNLMNGASSLSPRHSPSHGVYPLVQRSLKQVVQTQQPDCLGSLENRAFSKGLSADTFNLEVEFQGSK